MSMDTKISFETLERSIASTRLLKDKNGMSVDEGIVETVALFRSIGMNTSLSCFGHLDRNTGGPYIHFVSDTADKIRKEAAALNNPTSVPVKKLFNEARIENFKNYEILFFLLERFYKSHDRGYSSKLTVRSVGFSVVKLECLSIEMMLSDDEKIRRNILYSAQKEIVCFTEYLKREFMTL